MIYADNAATTRMSAAAVEIMGKLQEEAWGNPSSLYGHGQRAKEMLEDARKEIAARIGAEPGEIYFTSGGSESDNQAIRSAATLGKQAGKRHILSSAIEHHAVLHTLEQLKKEGFEIELLGVPEDGIIRPEEVAAALREDTCLVTVMYANNEIGTIQPIAEIGAICREKKVLFHTDAVQAMGHIPIDVVKDRVDLLSASAHKFHGPKGTTAETFFEQNYPDVQLLKYDSYTDAYLALLDGRGDGLSTDNTEVLAWAIENPGFSVGIESLGDLDTINPAVSKGNETLLAWINEELQKLGEENFFHADYEATLRETYGENADADSLVVEGGVI